MNKEEIEEAIQILEEMKDGYTFKDCETCFSNITGKGCIGKNKCEYIKAIDIILKEFEEKEKVIDAMAEVQKDKLERQIQIKDNYLDIIIDLGIDYDGCNTVDGLKELIDDLVDRSRKAYRNEDKTVEFINHSGAVNILHEYIESESEYWEKLKKKEK